MTKIDEVELKIQEILKEMSIDINTFPMTTQLLFMKMYTAGKIDAMKELESKFREAFSN